MSKKLDAPYSTTWKNERFHVLLTVKKRNIRSQASRKRKESEENDRT
jgi:hypothetical protein